MKICQFLHENEIKYGAIRGDWVYLFPPPEKMKETSGDLKLDQAIKKSEVQFLPPIEPRKIVCVGRNYAEHAKELGNEVPKEPLLFLKAPSAIITDDEPIIIPPQSSQVEHEGELGVVIGKTCKNLSENDNPFDFVMGYVCLNDVTARDLQKKDVQFSRSKSFDTFCPISHFFETEIDVSDIRVTTRVNGVIKQDGRTSQMVFPVPFLIRYISNQMSLHYGDIIATGTPAGVSKLQAGDVCEVEIEGVGILRNPVISS
ncbi:MAG TPA: fumarylacetoacetate hydrolase family protein [Pyrinomonadaceae bacterium]|nr:fumarylacetoacetate hydrolase family protein [Pyrinomonadaceae bacterium]